MTKRTTTKGRKDAPATVPDDAAFAAQQARALLGEPTPAPKAEGFLGRHLFGTLVLALLAALTITTSLAIVFPEPETPKGAPLFPDGIASPFTSEGFPCEEDEMLGYAAPEAGTSPDGIACVHIDVLDNNTIMDALAFCANEGGALVGFDFGNTDKPLCEPKETRGSTDATPTPDCQSMSATDQARLCSDTGSAFMGEATPCPAPTHVRCAPAPTASADSGRIVALCSEVSGRMRALVQGFTVDGEPPSRTLATKLGRVNEPLCKARTGTPASVLCTGTRTEVDAVLAQSGKEPDVLSLEQLAILRGIVDLVCEGQ